MSNLFGAPMDHGPLSVQTGFDELGRPIYRTPLGSIVGEAIPEPPRQNALASILRTDVDPFTGRAVHRREDLQPTRTGNALAALLQGVTQGLTAPGRAARGQPVTLGDVWATALESGALAAPMPAPAGAVRMFAGRTARTADLDALARAEDMARAGAAREDIWGQTGWFQGPDGQWRFEIDDSAARLTAPLQDYGWRGQLGDAIEHDSLFQAYPDLANIDTSVNWQMERRGRYDSPLSGSEEMMIGGYRAPDVEGTGLHEIQHAIQSREGFARGASPSEYRSGPMFDPRSRALAADFSREMTGGVAARPGEYLNDLRLGDQRRLAEIAQSHGFPSIDEAAAFLREQDELRTPFSQYQRTAGEVEARNAEARRDMPPLLRRMIAPWETQDTPNALQILRQPSGGPSLSVQSPADEIARMLREGRASEITDDMMARLSPEDNVRLFRLYEEGATGQPMPMDEASRMARAREMGFDPDTALYHGTHADFQQFSPPFKAGVDEYPVQQPVFAGLGPEVANYASSAAGGNVIPMVARTNRIFSGDMLQTNPSARWLSDSFSPLGRSLVDAVEAGRFGPDMVDDAENMVAAAAGGQWDILESAPMRSWLSEHGFDDFRLRESGAENIAITDPARIRSRFARFDPRLSHLAHLSAGGAGVAVLGGQEDQGGWEAARQYLREIGALE